MRSRKRAEAGRRPGSRREPDATRSPGLPSPEAVLDFLRDHPEAIRARELVRRLDDAAGRIVGVFRRTRDGGEIIPADRRDKSEYRVLGHDAVGLADNELVVAEELPSRRFGKRARIVERLGPADGPGAIS